MDQNKISRQIITTADGSQTIFLPELNEHYHSIHGALSESMHVFIEAGLQFALASGKKEIHLLEVGFGTGLNALLTLREAGKEKVNIFYTALEPFPLTSEIISNYNISQINEIQPGWFSLLHAAPPNIWTTIENYFHFRKITERLEDISFDTTFDLVYFDAFGPRAQPEIWSADNFKKIFAAMNPDGILVTYCSKGEVRRTMQAVGFTVTKLSGPRGKREMVRALV